MSTADVHFIYSMYRALYLEGTTTEGLLTAIIGVLVLIAAVLTAHVTRHWND